LRAAERRMRIDGRLRQASGGQAPYFAHDAHTAHAATLTPRDLSALSSTIFIGKTGFSQTPRPRPTKFAANQRQRRGEFPDLCGEYSYKILFFDGFAGSLYKTQLCRAGFEGDTFFKTAVILIRLKHSTSIPSAQPRLKCCCVKQLRATRQRTARWCPKPANI